MRFTTGLRGRISGFLAVIALVAVVFVVPDPSAPAAGAQPGIEIPDHVLEAVAAGESVELIVSGSGLPGTVGASVEAAVQAGLASQPEGDGAAGGELVMGAPFSVIDAVTVTVDSVEALQRVASLDGVRAIGLGSERAELHIDESIEITQAAESHANGLLGEGTTIAVIDGGVQADHPDLEDSITFEACFIEDRVLERGYCPGDTTERFGPGSAPDQSISHGTAVVGAIASAGVLAPMGVAPQADVEVYKIFADADGGFLTDLIRALDYIATDRPDVDVVNMSLGYAANFTGHCDSTYMALFDAIEVLRNQGVVSVASTGNGGLASMGAPACLSNVISVGASNDIEGEADFGHVAEFSNISTVTDLVAPGTQVETTRLGSTTWFFQGTSISSPTVAACAALARQSGLATALAVEVRLLTPSAIAPNPGGRAIPLVNCAFEGPDSGDVNCDDRRDVVDGLIIAQYVARVRSDAGSCPLGNAATQINLAEADINGDGTVDILDALVVTQCVVGIPNDVC